jgi:signal peptidase I
MSFNTVAKEIYSWIKTLFWVFLLSFLITVFVFEPYYVSGSSMEPTLGGVENPIGHGGDRVIVFKSPYLWWGARPKHGDIIVLDSRVARKRSLLDEVLENSLVRSVFGKEHSHIWIKRVIGEPGDILECREGKLYRNGAPLKEEYLENVEVFYDFEKFTVPWEHIFVMGDNRRYSQDSRQIGAVPLKNVKGRLILRYFPFDKVHRY